MQTQILKKLYTTLVRPNMEYASSVWDPLFAKDSDHYIGRCSQTC